MRSMQSVGKVRLDDGKHNIFRSSARRRPAPTPVHKLLRRFTLARNASPVQCQAEIGGYLGNAAITEVTGALGFLGAALAGLWVTPWIVPAAYARHGIWDYAH